MVLSHQFQSVARATASRVFNYFGTWFAFVALPMSYSAFADPPTSYRQFMAAPPPAAKLVQLESVPPDEDGRLRALINGLEAAQHALRKGEFETTAEYHARLKQTKGDEFIRGIRRGTRIAFPFPVRPGTFTYNADTETFSRNERITGENFPTFIASATNYISTYDRSSGYKSIKFLELDHDSSDSSYMGKNSFGASREITKQDTVSYGVRLEEWKFGDAHPNYSKWPRFKVPRAEAAVVKLNLMAVAIGELRDPPIVYDRYVHQATFSEPIESVEAKKMLNLALQEIVIFRVDGGMVLARMKIEDMAPLGAAAIKAETCENDTKRGDAMRDFYLIRDGCK